MGSLFLSVAVNRDLHSKDIGSWETMVVLEIVHEIICHGWRWLDFDRVGHDFGLQVIIIKLAVGSGHRDSDRSHCSGVST
jgi:hypothetical protein